MEPAETLRLDNVGEVTRLREEVARLTRERDAAEAIIGAHRWSRSGIQAELARLRAAIAPTEANVEFVAGFFDRYCTDDDGVTGWLDSRGPSTALLRALSDPSAVAEAAEPVFVDAANVRHMRALLSTPGGPSDPDPDGVTDAVAEAVALERTWQQERVEVLRYHDRAMYESLRVAEACLQQGGTGEMVAAHWRAVAEVHRKSRNLIERGDHIPPATESEAGRG